MKNLAKTKWFIYGTYLLLVFSTLLICFVLLKNGDNSINKIVTSFFEVAENRTFDYRQSIKVNRQNSFPNKDIVILAIDDASMESLWDKYGEWPIPRNVYADIIEYLETEQPKAIIFDLMFIKSLKTSKDADSKLISTMNKYSNIYTGINFDNMDYDAREPINLPERLSVKVNNTSKANFIKYKNCRPIIDGLLNGNVNVASTNTERDADGIIRHFSPIMLYNNNYYPHLAFKAGADYILNKNLEQLYIDNDRNLQVEDVKIPLTSHGNAILNWYSHFDSISNTYPLYKLINEMSPDFQGTKFNFKDKFIFLGVTADSMYDIKSVPIEKKYPGVTIQATVLNNILDNNFIKKTDSYLNVLITAAVILLVGAIVMLSNSTVFALLSTVLFGIAYVFVSYYILVLYNLWIPIVLPVLAVVAAFTLSILAKYLMKSRDFEYQYKLATLDGLTELYNHRYFQDTLRKQIDIARRYNQSVSLIICDIDFFKKFNDTYGHQTGDAVLRQVAQTLKKNSRVTDFVCRYGGEEMSIILPNTNAEEAMLLANRICSAVSEKPFHITPVDKTNITISLGVSTFPDNAQTPQDLIEWADKGLYYAKEHGRNQVGRY